MRLEYVWSDSMRRMFGIFSGLLAGLASFAACILFLIGSTDSLEGQAYLRRDDGIVGGLLAIAFLLGRLAQGIGTPRRILTTAIGFVVVWFVVSGGLIAWHNLIERVRFSAPRTLTLSRKADAFDE